MCSNINFCAVTPTSLQFENCFGSDPLMEFHVLLQLKICFSDSPPHPSNESCKCYNGGRKGILLSRVHTESALTGGLEQLGHSAEVDV